MPEINPLPKHVAVIMDGNRRWARQHAFQVALGHRKGVEAVRTIVRESSDLGIGILSLYAFSTENWQRDQREVDTLMALLQEFFTSDIDELDEKNVRIRILGVRERLPKTQRETVIRCEERTKNNTGLQLNLGINYGSQDEILRMVRAIARDAAQGICAPDRIDEAVIRDHLDTANQPDVDLLIRTSGEMRLSNFLLYQCAYAELYFTPVLWPDFGVKEYHEALEEFSHRQRRHGG